MKVTISVNGRFHAADMAKQLQARDMLARLITPLPAWRMAHFGIDRAHIRAMPYLEALKRLKNLGSMANRRRVVALQAWLFDAAAARSIPADTDIFVGFAGSSLRSMRRARALGAATVLQRSSVHIETQMAMLHTEYARRGQRFVPPTAATLARETAEYAEADLIEVPSRFAAKSFLDRGFDPDKIAITPMGVDFETFLPKTKEDDVFRVIFAGGLSFQKGSANLLEAMAGLDLPNFEFWHLGTVNPEMAPLVARHAAPHLKFLGHIPQHSLGWYYSQGSVLILPSIQDGFGMVVPQAMSCGLPVICSTATGAADIIQDGHTGLIVPPADTEAIAQAVRMLYAAPDRARLMGAAARASLDQIATWDSYGARITSLYLDLAADSGA